MAPPRAALMPPQSSQPRCDSYRVAWRLRLIFAAVYAFPVLPAITPANGSARQYCAAFFTKHLRGAV